ncbi:trimeric intracellular cation channel family protein [Limisalsivibrio acetivorans]|uniref:trimeric intracellular cation channel family protein n=1 Tax=Limisalsivibrio acetivorans TaxID=1304888 RepID=UPI0003B4E62C|nr:trimeric intracellular cation channel family protein [Limisalsivibrio acetivorans]
MSLFYFLDMIGTVAFGVTGGLAGIKKRMDIYGVAVLAIVTAVGGGTVRDVLVGDVPPFFFEDYNYILVSVTCAVLVFKFHDKFEKKLKLFLVMDAVGLGVFTVTGVSVGIAHDVGWLGSIMLGVITGTFGGMIRDVLRQEIPLVLTREIYALASIAGGFLYCVLYEIGVTEWLTGIVTASVVFSLRVTAIIKNWSLPSVDLEK